MAWACSASTPSSTSTAAGAGGSPTRATSFISSYVIFGLAKAQKAGFAVDADVLKRGVRYVQRLVAPQNLKALPVERASLHGLCPGRGRAARANRAGALYDSRDKLSNYAKAYLALALGVINDGGGQARIKTLLADLTGKAITSATTTHWEEDVRRLLEHEHRHPHHVDRAGCPGQARPEEQPGAEYRALADGRAQGRPLGNDAGERLGDHGADRLDGRHRRAGGRLRLARDPERRGAGPGHRDAGHGGEVTTLHADIEELLLDQTNAVMIGRTAPGADREGQLYYTMHLKSYLPVDRSSR